MRLNKLHHRCSVKYPAKYFVDVHLIIIFFFSKVRKTYKATVASDIGIGTRDNCADFRIAVTLNVSLSVLSKADARHLLKADTLFAAIHIPWMAM